MTDYLITFSPTGGTGRVCSILADELLNDAEPVDLLEAKAETELRSFGPGDLCILGVPSFGGRVPSVIPERVANLKAEGTRCILVCTYGNRAFEDTLLELQDLAISSGFVPIAAVAAVTQHSIFPQYGKGRPNEEDEAELRSFAAQIRPLLDMEPRELKLPGDHLYREFHGVPLKPKANGDCEACGLCASSCPVGAIDPADPKETDEKKCITCMHCVSICPNKARSLNSMLVGLAAATSSYVFREAKKNSLYLMA